MLDLDKVTRGRRLVSLCIAAVTPGAELLVGSGLVNRLLEAHPKIGKLDPFGIPWFSALLDVVADGFDGCPGLGIERAAAYTLEVWTSVQEGQAVDLSDETDFVAVWMAQRKRTQCLN